MSTTIAQGADLKQLFSNGGMQHTNMSRSPSAFFARPNENGYDAVSLEAAQYITEMAMSTPEPKETRFNKREASNIISITAQSPVFDNSRTAVYTISPEAAPEATKIAMQTEEVTPFYKKEATNVIRSAFIAHKTAQKATFEEECKEAVNTVLDIALSKAQSGFFYATKADASAPEVAKVDAINIPGMAY